MGFSGSGGKRRVASKSERTLAAFRREWLSLGDRSTDWVSRTSRFFYKLCWTVETTETIWGCPGFTCSSPVDRWLPAVLGAAAGFFCELGDQEKGEPLSGNNNNALSRVFENLQPNWALHGGWCSTIPQVMCTKYFFFFSDLKCYGLHDTSSGRKTVLKQIVVGRDVVCPERVIT